MSAFHWRERTFQVAGWIAFSSSGGNRIAEDLPAVAQGAVGGFQGAPLFDPANHFQQLRGGDVGYRRTADPGEDVSLQAADDPVAMIG